MGRKRKQKAEPDYQLNVRLPLSIISEVEEAAKAQSVTMREVVHNALVSYFIKTKGGKNGN